jgi:hypothetical protein
VGRAQLEDHLVLGAEVDLLQVAPLVHVPDVQGVAVLVGQQQVALQALLDHLRGPPRARDERVVVDVPPEVVGELLRAAVLLPRALEGEVVVVHEEQPARPAAVGGAEGAHVQPVGPAVRGVRARVARLARELVRLDDLDDLRGERVVLDVDDVDPRRAQPGDDEVAALDVRHRRPRAQRARARVPAEVVQLVADVRHVEAADGPPVGRRLRVDVDHRDRVRLAVAVRADVQRRDVRDLLGRAGDGLGR